MDLGELEKKLSDQIQQRRQDSQPTSSNLPSPTRATPRHDESLESPHSSLSPGPIADIIKERQSPSAEPSDNKPSEVEQLSDMMCSLVTTQTGDTNYTGETVGSFGRSWRHVGRVADIGGCLCRILFGLFHLLTQGNTVGQRKDRRQLVPNHHIQRLDRLQQVDSLEARGIPRLVFSARLYTTSPKGRGFRLGCLVL